MTRKRSITKRERPFGKGEGEPEPKRPGGKDGDAPKAEGADDGDTAAPSDPASDQSAEAPAPASTPTPSDEASDQSAEVPASANAPSPETSSATEASADPATRKRFDTLFSKLFFGALAVGVVALALVMLKPFLNELFIAFILFVMTLPLYHKLMKLFRGKRALSSAVSCVVVILLVLVPLVVVAGLLATQAYDFSIYVKDEFQSGAFNEYLNFKDSPLIATLREYIPALDQGELDLTGSVSKYMGQISQVVGSQALATLKGLSNYIVGFFFVIFILFFFLMDGERLLAELKRLSPFDDDINDELFDELIGTLKATFKSTLLVALAQGALGTVGLLICGIESWALWGTVMVFASFIPVVGTALIWLPAALYLGLSGSIVWAVVMVAWGVVVIGAADQVLRPILLKGSKDIHPLLIFFSIMGGLSYFGFLGLILGPLVLSLLLYVLEVYKRYFNPKPDRP